MSRSPLDGASANARYERLSYDSPPVVVELDERFSLVDGSLPQPARLAMTRPVATETKGPINRNERELCIKYLQ
jgi:hypothetical protein